MAIVIRNFREITASEKRIDDSILYVGRWTQERTGLKSVGLGNDRYPIPPFTREESLERFRQDIPERLLFDTAWNKNLDTVAQIVVERERLGLDTEVVCHCVPRDCHAKDIARLVADRAQKHLLHRPEVVIRAEGRETGRVSWVSLVGSRNISVRTVREAIAAGRALGEAGYGCISGGAEGADTCGAIGFLLGVLATTPHRSPDLVGRLESILKNEPMKLLDRSGQTIGNLSLELLAKRSDPVVATLRERLRLIHPYDRRLGTSTSVQTLPGNYIVEKERDLPMLQSAFSRLFPPMAKKMGAPTTPQDLLVLRNMLQIGPRDKDGMLVPRSAVVALFAFYEAAQAPPSGGTRFAFHAAERDGKIPTYSFDGEPGNRFTEKQELQQQIAERRLGLDRQEGPEDRGREESQALLRLFDNVR